MVQQYEMSFTGDGITKRDLFMAQFVRRSLLTSVRR
jgi:hypothetical protein